MQFTNRSSKLQKIIVVACDKLWALTNTYHGSSSGSTLMVPLTCNPYQMRSYSSAGKAKTYPSNESYSSSGYSGVLVGGHTQNMTHPQAIEFFDVQKYLLWINRPIFFNFIQCQKNLYLGGLVPPPMGKSWIHPDKFFML